MNTVVERELELTLVLPPHRIPVPALLSYRTDDPRAVHFTIHLDSVCPITWRISRSLLVEGVFRPCTRGDVSVWPTQVGGRKVLCMALRPPLGRALLEVPAAAVSAWLERTLTLVAPDTESDPDEPDENVAKAPAVRCSPSSLGWG
ncbi:SsgA family sporulation/cell division regulator [Streptomyces sp. NPDC020681]|uniref:SsgA family sporulation/cell division regulator n=1 Tax=Streptomyces sp. NPDC020681 TaxID=3365083 RepID=UPI0037944579